MQKVHSGRTDKPGDKHIGRIFIYFVRFAYLLNIAVLHYDYARSHSHSLNLVVRYVNSCCADLVMYAHDFASHSDAQFCVEVGKRFVHKENFGTPYNRPAQRNALTLAARQRAGFSVQIGRKLQYLRSFLNASVNLVFGGLAEFKRIRHIVVNGHLRIERVRLEHHCDVPVFRRGRIHNFTVD